MVARPHFTDRRPRPGVASLFSEGRRQKAEGFIRRQKAEGSRRRRIYDCLLPSAYCLPPSAYCLPPSAYCLPPSAFRLLPSAFCLLMKPSDEAFCPHAAVIE